MKQEAKVLIACGFENEYGDYHVATFGDHIRSGGYKESYKPDNMDAIILERNAKDDRYFFFVDPYADTIYGRQQADAIEDWLFNEHFALWVTESGGLMFQPADSRREWRLKRIKWCMKQLEDDDATRS